MPQVIRAASALGVDVRRHIDNAISFVIELPTPSGLKKAHALLDSGAQANFVSQLWAKDHDLRTRQTPRRVKALDGHCVTSYGQTTLPVVATDNQGITREVTQPLEAVDLDIFDVILGYPWLRDVNPMVDWPSMAWAYKEGRMGEKVEVIGEKKVEHALQKGRTIYVAFASLADDGAIHVGQAHTDEDEGSRPPADMRPEYADYGDVASEENASTLPAHQDHDHVIELQPGTQPPHRPIYNLSEKELEVLREYLESAMNKGWIRPSTSPAGAPILFIPKKDGGLRLCVDY